MNQSKFAIIQSKGFQMTFANGYTVSVQFGQYNYCNGYDNSHENGVTNTNAEIAFWHSAIDMERLLEIPFETGTVSGYKSTDEVFEFMRYVKELPAPAPLS